MTVPAAPGLEPLVLTDLPADFAALERFAVPQLGSRIFAVVDALRSRMPASTISTRFGVSVDDLMLVHAHFAARGLVELGVSRALARELARIKTARTHAAATHPEDDDDG